MIKKISIALSIITPIVISGCSSIGNNSADASSQMYSDTQVIENFLTETYELRQVEILCPYNPDPNAKKVKLDRTYEVLIQRQYRPTDEYYICNLEVLVKRSVEWVIKKIFAKSLKVV